MVTKNCVTCEKPFCYEPFLRADGSERFAITYCEPCIEQSRTEEDVRMQAEIQNRHEERWAAICPPLYRTTDAARIPASFRAAIAGWNYSPRGLGFIGAAGQGKTRAAFVLLRRIFGEERTCEATSATQFARLSFEQFSDDKDRKQRAAATLSHLRTVELLLIDDLGKSKMTDRCEVEFFDLLEHRTSHLLPTLWTANARGNDLLALMSPDRGEPILRRLAEFSEIVTV